MVKRSTVIGRRYGLTSRNMNRTLTKFNDILETFDGKATFPITGAALSRSQYFTSKHNSQRIEFAAHGYYHVDHKQLSLPDQAALFDSVGRLFTSRGLKPTGFRCPYLRWNEDTIAAIQQAGFVYDSSQALVWDVDEACITDAYRRVLQFYGAVPAKVYPALPRLESGLVRIPYCLPDDEALIDRLYFSSADSMNQIWPDILQQTYHLGELFTLGLHPERLDLCEAALVQTMQDAHQLSPAVWFARLDEVAHWWQARTNVTVTLSGDNPIHVTVSELDGVTVLARGVEVNVQSELWDDNYRRVCALEFDVHSGKRPFIAISPTSDPYLTSFLQQQGYIVERAPSDEKHTFYLDRPQFGYEDERPLLTQIEQGTFPLVRLGRWPNGTRSAICITGDIDALTIWDYGLRFLGN